MKRTQVAQVLDKWNENDRIVKVVYMDGAVSNAVKGEVTLVDDFLHVRLHNGTETLVAVHAVVKLEAYNEPGPPVPSVPKKHIITQEVRA